MPFSLELVYACTLLSQLNVSALLSSLESSFLDALHQVASLACTKSMIRGMQKGFTATGASSAVAKPRSMPHAFVLTHSGIETWPITSLQLQPRELTLTLAFGCACIYRKFAGGYEGLD